jgi:hypothetical protein
MIGLTCLALAVTHAVNEKSVDYRVRCGDLTDDACALWMHLCDLMPIGYCAARDPPCSESKAWVPRGGDEKQSPCDEENFSWWVAGGNGLRKAGICCNSTSNAPGQYEDEDGGGGAGTLEFTAILFPTSMNPPPAQRTPVCLSKVTYRGHSSPRSSSCGRWTSGGNQIS